MAIKRYGIVHDGFMPREIVLLQALSCSWGKCTFCDYCADNNPKSDEAAKLNAKVLQQVTGKYGVLQVIDSASWVNLPATTHAYITSVCAKTGITKVILEGHWNDRDTINFYRNFYSNAGITLKFIVGAESLSPARRIRLNKGMDDSSTADFVWSQDLKEHFEAINLLYGDTYSMSAEQFSVEIERCADMFEWVNVSIFTNNPRAKKNGIVRKPFLVQSFYERVLPRLTEIAPKENVFVFDYADSRAPHNLGGVGEEE